MGFPCVVIKVPKWCISLRNLVDYFRTTVMVALNHLRGLLKSSARITTESTTDSMEEQQQQQHLNDSILMFDHMCPSMVPVPIHVLIAYIKRRLPAVEFGIVIEKYTKHESEGTTKHESEGTTTCNICLECIERSHEVREQSNCDHVFHRECLDSWVNQRQVTCPLCRATLFSAKRGKTSCQGNPWTMDRDAYLDRLDFIVGRV